MDGRGWSECDALGWDVVMVMVMVMLMVMFMDTVYGSVGKSRQV